MGRIFICVDICVAPGLMEQMKAEKLTHRSSQHRGHFAELSTDAPQVPHWRPVVMPGVIIGSVLHVPSELESSPLLLLAAPQYPQALLAPHQYVSSTHKPLLLRFTPGSYGYQGCFLAWVCTGVNHQGRLLSTAALLECPSTPKSSHGTWSCPKGLDTFLNGFPGKMV